MIRVLLSTLILISALLVGGVYLGMHNVITSEERGVPIYPQ